MIVLVIFNLVTNFLLILGRSGIQLFKKVIEKCKKKQAKKGIQYIKEEESLPNILNF